jgi:hypothetical protein
VWGGDQQWSSLPRQWTESVPVRAASFRESHSAPTCTRCSTVGVTWRRLLLASLVRFTRSRLCAKCPTHPAQIAPMVIKFVALRIRVVSYLCVADAKRLHSPLTSVPRIEYRTATVTRWAEREGRRRSPSWCYVDQNGEVCLKWDAVGADQNAFFG